MSKTYLRYEPAQSFGVIHSASSNLVYFHRNDKSGSANEAKKRAFLATSGVRQVLIWNVHTGDLDLSLLINDPQDSNPNITSLAVDSSSTYIGAGTQSGSIHLWLQEKGESYARLNGHRSAVTCLGFTEKSTRLCSGSKDTDVIVWDVIAQRGLFRLKGHKDEVTALQFIETPGSSTLLLSSSKDSMMKVWDTETQSCAHTLVGHRTSVWSFAVAVKSKRVVTGSTDHMLRGVDINAESPTEWSLMEGSVQRQSNDRVVKVQFSQDGALLACQTVGKSVEVYKVRSAKESQRKLKRRLKRVREKHKLSAEEEGLPPGEEKEQTEKSSKLEEQLKLAGKPQLNDELELACIIRVNSAVSSLSFGERVMHEGDRTVYEVVLGLKSNSVEIYQLQFDNVTGQTSTKKRKHDEAKEVKIKRSQVLEFQGHRTDVRTCSLSSDQELLLTAGNGAVKLWNVKTQQCLRTMPSGYSLCSAFVPGDMHAVVGTKEGRLLLFKLSSGELLTNIEAHEGALWSLDLRPDERGLVTGSADKVVKFFDLELVEKEVDGGEGKKEMELDLLLTRKLNMSEDVLCVRYSHHKSRQKLMLAVALLDCTVKVFHEDSLKFALSLYGHRLPVLTMDISDDNSLLVTGSADKNIKVWGLDFGDCHKSFFAHDAAVMCTRFVAKTHYVFSVGKDGRLRYWDADKFDMILSIDAHVGQAWSVDVANDGAFVVTCGHDKSLRFWERTQDIVFVEEEREKELERLFDSKLDGVDAGGNRGSLSIPAIQAEKKLAQANASGEIASEVPSRRTGEAVRSGERLMDAIDLAWEEMTKLDAFDKSRQSSAGEKVSEPQPNLLLLGRSPAGHVAYTLMSLKPTDVDEALLVQPFDYAQRLLQILLRILESESREGFNIELMVKCCVHLVKAHFNQIVATQSLKLTLLQLKDTIRDRLSGYQEVLGTNMVRLKFIQEDVALNTRRDIDS